MAILVGSKAASRTVMQRPANKTFDMVLAVTALLSFDSGSNPDSGAYFLSSFGERSHSAQGKKCKLECKLFSNYDRNSLSDLVLTFS
jgi:hypothetical protein